MYQIQEYCQSHSQNLVTHICVVKHDCLRKLCPICEHDHQKIVPHNQILPLEVFQQRKLEIAKYNLEDQNQVNKAEENNKSLISDIESKLIDLLKDLRISQQKIFDDFREQDQYYLNLLQQNPLESSQNELNIIVNLFQDNILEVQTKKKNKILQHFQDRLDLLRNSFIKLIAIFKDQIRSSTPINFNSYIQKGPKYFGLKHGKFQYILDGVIENAGEFKFGQKVNLWNQFGLEINKGRLDKVIFQIDYNQKKGYITYIKDHQILNRISLEPNLTQQQILYNLELIKLKQKDSKLQYIFEEEFNNHQQNGYQSEILAIKWNNQLTFTGSYRLEKRFDRWNIIYSDQIIGGGVYDENGNKNGNWIDVHNNFYNKCQVTYDGEYRNGKRYLNFDIMFRVDQNEPFHKIGGGYYDANGIKQGRWMEASDYFCLDGQVILEGEYKDGKQIGKWIQIYREKDEYKFIQIGGGEFNQKGIKEGLWVELDQTYQKDRQLIYKGEYGSGKKIGQWKIIYRQDQTSQFQDIGGGSYNEQELRYGYWIELSKNFQKDSQIIYQGHYQDGLKLGEWKIMFRLDEKNEFKQIGQGMFDQNCSKEGDWTEPYNNFTNQQQIILKGEYRLGKKYGEWDILIRFDSHSNFEKIGGGSFDENELKNGIWKELNPIFSQEYQILEIGEYKNGVKMGLWKIQIRNGETQELLFQGGGNYDQVGMKTDQWNDIDEQFASINQFIYQGVYCNGKKINKWEINYLDGNQLKKIGEGSYNQSNLKDGKWVDVKETFKNAESYCIISMQGVYKNGKKIGLWKTYNKYKGQNQSFFIGESSYDENGTKIGKWLEVDDEFQKNRQIIYEGIYKDGRRFSKWKASYFSQQFERIKIGSGIYDDDGLKNGKWIDIHKNFTQDFQIILEGTYRQGNKVGKWDIQISEKKMKFQIIGGGQYDQKGVKMGSWIELHNNFQKKCQVKYQGQYQNGMKIGDWVIYYNDQNNSAYNQYIKLGGGSYNEKGQKHGDWVDLHQNFSGERYVIYDIVYNDGVIVKQKGKNY